MFSGLTLQEQRVLIVLILLIGTGLGVRHYRSADWREGIEILTPDDLAPSTHPDLAQPLIGLRATRFIEAGVPITQAMLEPVPTVDRGDLVTLVIEVGAIRIRAMAEVRAPASAGRMTKVRVLQTNKLLDAQVLDSQTVSLPAR